MGAVLLGTEGIYTAAGSWKEHQTHWSINLKELMAVRLALVFLRRHLDNNTITLKVDNTTVVHQLYRIFPTENFTAERIRQKIAAENIRFTSVEWVSTTTNIADAYSRMLTQL